MPEEVFENREADTEVILSVSTNLGETVYVSPVTTKELVSRVELPHDEGMQEEPEGSVVIVSDNEHVELEEVSTDEKPVDDGTGGGEYNWLLFIMVTLVLLILILLYQRTKKPQDRAV